jgi:Right handed beta helix region
MKLARLIRVMMLVGSFAGPALLNSAARGISYLTVYYVAQNGNDNFSGRLPAPNSARTDGPFKTLTRAQVAVEIAKRHGAGQIMVEIRRGVYFLSAPLEFNSADSGSASGPITWEGYPGDNEPIISGGRRLIGWKQGSNDVWTLRFPRGARNFEALYYNGVRRLRPKLIDDYLTLNPVFLSSPAKNCTEHFAAGYRCSDRFSFNPGDISATLHDLSDVEVISFEDWTVSRMRLASIDSIHHVAYLTGPVARGTCFGFLSGHRYLLDNVEEKLSEPGQWYLNRATTPWTLRYMARPGENPNRDTVIVPQQANLLVANGLQYVTFRNIRFAHDDYTIPAAGHPGVSGEFHTPAALSFNNSSNVVLSGITIAHTQAWAVEFEGTAVAGQGNTVNNSALYDLGTGGIRLGQVPNPYADSDARVSQDNTVSDNVIASGGRFLPGGEGTGIWLGSTHNNTVTHNDVHDFYNGAIELGQTPDGSTTYTHDNVISWNLLYDLGQGVTSDMGCVHAASSNNKGNKILNNVCHDVTQDPGVHGYGGRGIYLDSNTSNVLVENNLVYRVSDAGLYVSYLDTKDTITNNIFAFSRNGSFSRAIVEPAGNFLGSHNIFYYDKSQPQRMPGAWVCQGNCTGKFDLDWNLYWAVGGGAPEFVTTGPGDPAHEAAEFTLPQWQSELGEDLHSQHLNPGFVNAAYPGDNYALASNSPALTKIGFVPFETADAGPVNKIPLPTVKVPEAFPVRLMNPATDF